MFQAAVRYGILMVNAHDAYAVNRIHFASVAPLMNKYREEVLEAYKPVWLFRWAFVLRANQCS